MASLVAWPVAQWIVNGLGANGSARFGTCTVVPEPCWWQPVRAPVETPVDGSNVATKLAQTLVPPAAAEAGLAVVASELPMSVTADTIVTVIASMRVRYFLCSPLEGNDMVSPPLCEDWFLDRSVAESPRIAVAVRSQLARTETGHVPRGGQGGSGG